jgi:hypothetical protein
MPVSSLHATYSGMRLSLFVFSAAEVFLWLIGTIVLHRQQIDATGFHAIFIIFALAAIVIGIWGRWLQFGGTLIIISLILTFSFIAASQISS